MISYNHGYDGDMAVRTASAPGHHHHSTGVYSSSLEKVHKSPRIFFKMPRVVPNQKERFETEDIFKKNTKDQEVRYTPYRERPMHERQSKFQQGLREGHVEVSLSGTGLVLILTWNPIHSSTAGPSSSSLAPSSFGALSNQGCDFHKEPGKVHIRASLILNGVCVQWRGWIALDRLEGAGRLEFDEEMAQVEDRYLQQQIDYYNHRLKDLDNNNK